MSREEELLKQLIEKNGYAYLEENPYQIYEYLMRHGTDQITARAVLSVLTAEIKEKAEKMGTTALCSYLEKECSFHKQMAEEMASLFSSLYGSENRNQWKQNELRGFKDFCEKTWSFRWEGEAVWNYGSGSLECYGEGSAELSVEDHDRIKEELSVMLERNPFLTEDDIYQYFLKQFGIHIDEEFEDFCTGDDYYPPSVEDFEFEHCVEVFSQKYGFTFDEVEYDGGDRGYEPRRYRHGW